MKKTSVLAVSIALFFTICIQSTAMAGTFLQCGNLMYEIDYENRTVTRDSELYTEDGHRLGDFINTVKRMDDSYIELESKSTNTGWTLGYSINRKTGMQVFSNIKPNGEEGKHSGESVSCTKIVGNKF
jgi:hypothetical protein